MKSSVLLYLFVFLPLFLGGQVDFISGRIVNESGMAQTRVIVILTDYSGYATETNDKGEFKFDISDIQLGNQVAIKFYKILDPYPQRKIVTIGKDGNIVGEIEIKEEKEDLPGSSSTDPPPPDTFHLVGKVVNGKEIPLKGVRVISRGLPGAEALRTDDEGIFSFLIVNPNLNFEPSYPFELSKNNYASKNINARLTKTGLTEPFPFILECEGAEGESCDDGDPETFGDKWDANCQCKGRMEKIKWKEYTGQLFSFGILGGIGYRKGHQVRLGEMPSSIRNGRPHPNDLRNIPQLILDPNIPDSYLVTDNFVDVDLSARVSFDLVNISIKRLVFMNLRWSPFQKELAEVRELNLQRKNYIIPSAGFEAFTYYSVITKEKLLNFSIPIYGTVPLFRFGKNHEFVLKAIAGTNLISPTIELEAIKGWDREGDFEHDEEIDIGKLAENEIFLGFDIEKDRNQFGFQLAFTSLKFKPSTREFDAVQLSSSSILSFWLKFAHLLK